MLLQRNFRAAFFFLLLTLPGAILLWKLLLSYGLLLLPWHYHLLSPSVTNSSWAISSCWLQQLQPGEKKPNQTKQQKTKPKTTTKRLKQIYRSTSHLTTNTAIPLQIGTGRLTHLNQQSLNIRSWKWLMITRSTQMKQGEKARFPYGSPAAPRCHGGEQKASAIFSTPLWGLAPRQPAPDTGCRAHWGHGAGAKRQKETKNKEKATGAGDRGWGRVGIERDIQYRKRYSGQGARGRVEKGERR